MAKIKVTITDNGGDSKPIPGITEFTIRGVRPPAKDGTVGQARWSFRMLDLTRSRGRVRQGRVPKDDITTYLASLLNQDAYFSGEILVYHESNRNTPVSQIRFDNGHLAEFEFGAGPGEGLDEQLGIAVPELEIDGYRFPNAYADDEEEEDAA